MSNATITPEERYATIVETMLNTTHASYESPATKRFGSDTLKINNKIFAMLFKGQIVFKLPRQQVDALVAAHAGERFDTGNGRPMKEWISLDPSADVDWIALANEALAFVGAKA